MITGVKHPEWEPIPIEGAVGVEGKVFLDEPEVGLAMLRFGPQASSPEHGGDTDNWVVCVEGSGFVRVGGQVAAISAGEKVFWPKGVPQQLFTEGSGMTTLMVHPSVSERDGGRDDRGCCTRGAVGDLQRTVVGDRPPHQAGGLEVRIRWSSPGAWLPTSSPGRSHRARRPSDRRPEPPH